MKASKKMLGSRRASSPLLDLLGSGDSQDQPAQLQLRLARTPEWGQGEEARTGDARLWVPPCCGKPPEAGSGKAHSGRLADGRESKVIVYKSISMTEQKIGQPGPQ